MAIAVPDADAGLGRLTLTAYGQRFARDVRPALESLAQTRKGKDDNHRTLSRAPPGLFSYPVTSPPRAVQLQRNAQLMVFKFSRSLHGGVGNRYT